MSKLKAALQALADQARANHIHRMSEMQVQANYVAKVLELLGWKDSDDGGVEAGGNGGLSKKTLNTGGKKICPRIRGHQDYIIRPGYLGSGLRLIEVNVTKKNGECQ